MLNVEVTEEDFWALVDEIDFSRPSHEVRAELTLQLAPLEQKAIRDWVWALKSDLTDEVYEADNKPDWTSEDGVAETIGSVLARRKSLYYGLMDSPSDFWKDDGPYENTSKPILGSYLPWQRGYSKVAEGYFRRKGEHIAEKYEELTSEKYAEDYRQAALTLKGMLEDGVHALQGRGIHSEALEDNVDRDADYMVELAEMLSDDVDARFVQRYARDFRLYYQAYYN